MQNFNTAELRPVEFARAYLQKKMMKKPLREDDGADVLRGSTCSAHVSRKPLIPSARITHRCRSLPPQIGVHEGTLESVHEREFAKFLFSLQSFVWRTQRGLIRAPAIPETGCRRTSDVHPQHSPARPPARPHTMVG